MRASQTPAPPDMAGFPLPSRALACSELQRDACYQKIPPQDCGRILEAAWSKGEGAAARIFEQYGGETSLCRVAAHSGLGCRWDERDYAPAGRRRFAEYLPHQGCVQLYRGSIRLLAQKNGIPEERALNLVLGHEYFHFLEHTSLGWTSRDYLVPMLQLGPLRLGKTGIRALSEVGAHAFACTYCLLGDGRAAAGPGLLPGQDFIR